MSWPNYKPFKIEIKEHSAPLRGRQDNNKKRPEPVYISKKCSLRTHFGFNRAVTY